MNYRAITANDYARLATEMRDLRQWEAEDGAAAIVYGRHPLFGRIAMVLDGERYGLVPTTPLPPFRDLLPGHHDCPCRSVGPQWASLAALAGMVANLNPG